MKTLENRLLGLLPTVALVVLVLVVGFVLSRLAGRGAAWLLRRTGLEALAERAGVSRVLYATGLRTALSDVLERAVYYIGLLITLLVAADAAGLSGVADGLSVAVRYLPQALVAGVIVLVGVRAAELARGLVLRSARRRGGVDSPEAVGRLVYWMVIVLALAVGANQLGLETGLVNGVVLIVVGGTVLGVALALALSARAQLGHVVARYYAARLFRPGDSVRFRDERGEVFEGTVVRYSPTAALIRTSDGDWAVPATALTDRPVALVRAADRPPAAVVEKKSDGAE